MRTALVTGNVSAETCGIYLLKNSENAKVYVGQSVHIKQRVYEHRKSAKRGDKSHLYDAMRKYGVDAFVCEVLEECTPEQLDEKEAIWMDFYECLNSDSGYNYMPAGQRGRVMDAAMRAKLSELSKGYKHTEEALEKMRAASTGKTHSDETKAKISQANLGRIVSKETSQLVADALTARWAAMSDEDKLAYGEKRSGWKHSDQLKQAVSERFKGKPKSDQQKANMSAAYKSKTPEEKEKHLAALRLANGKRWNEYRANKQEATVQ